MGALLQLGAHSWIAGSLFLVVGDMYEVQGTRSTKAHHYSTKGAGVLLAVLLANSAGGHVSVEVSSPMYSVLVPGML